MLIYWCQSYAVPKDQAVDDDDDDDDNRKREASKRVFEFSREKNSNWGTTLVRN